MSAGRKVDFEDDMSGYASHEVRVGAIAAAWRYRWLVVGIAVLFAALSAAAGYVRTPAATATATLSLTNPGADSVFAPGVTGDASLARYTAQRASFLLSNDVLSTVARDIGLSGPAAARRHLTISSTDASNVISVEATGSSRAVAASLAADVVNVYRAKTLKQVNVRTARAVASIDRDSAQVSAAIRGLPARSPDVLAAASSIAQLDERSSSIRSESAAFGDGVDWATTPTVAQAHGRPLPLKSALVGLLAGLALAVLLAWAVADRNAQIRRPSQPASLLGSPFLGLARSANLVGRRRDDPPPTGSSVAVLVEPAIAVASSHAPGVFLVVDVTPSGTSADVARGVVAGLVYEGRDAVLVDADFAKGADVESAVPGFAEMLRRGDGMPEPEPEELDVQGVRISALPRGGGDVLPGRSGELVGLRTALDDLRSAYDYVVIDGGHFGEHPITAVLASLCDGLVFVVQERELEQNLASAKTSADVLHAKVVGYVYADRTVGARSPSTKKAATEPASKQVEPVVESPAESTQEPEEGAVESAEAAEPAEPAEAAEPAEPAEPAEVDHDGVVDPEDGGSAEADVAEGRS